MRKSVTITVERRKDGRISAYFQSGDKPREQFARIAPGKWVAGYGCTLNRAYEKVCEDLLEAARRDCDEE